MKRLERKRANRRLAGVCAGLGAYFKVDPLIFRLLFFGLSFFHGLGLVLYVLAAWLMPMEPLKASDFGFFSNFFTDGRDSTSGYSTDWSSRSYNQDQTIYNKDDQNSNRRPRKDVTPD